MTSSDVDVGQAVPPGIAGEYFIHHNNRFVVPLVCRWTMMRSTTPLQGRRHPRRRRRGRIGSSRDKAQTLGRSLWE